MRKSTSSPTARVVRAIVTTGAVAALVVAGTAVPASAASVPVTLSSAAGSSGGGQTITASSTAVQAFLSGVTTPFTTFSMPACPLVYTTALSSSTTPSSTTVGNVPVVTSVKLSNSKASILVPALTVISPATSTKYNVCIYAGTTVAAPGPPVVAASPLVGTSTYTVAVAPVFPAVSVSPLTGPALGGTTITVTATSGLPTTAGSITGTLGGVALTGVTPISATSFTAITPAHAPGEVTLSVTTSAGTKSMPGVYTYANGITASPNTAPPTGTVYVDVQGAGFLNNAFGVAATNARVWLVKDAYDPGVTGDTTYTDGPTAECVLPVVISDNELICSINLLTGELTPATGAPLTLPVPNGTYTLTVASNGDPGASDLDGYSQTDLSSGSTFTVAPY